MALGIGWLKCSHLFPLFPLNSPCAYRNKKSCINATLGELGATREKGGKVGTEGTRKKLHVSSASKEIIKKEGADVKDKTIGVTEDGYRVGESHQRAKLSDVDVEKMRDLYEEGVVGYRTLAKAFRCSRNTVKCIVKYRRRNATMMNSKTVRP